MRVFRSMAVAFALMISAPAFSQESQEGTPHQLIDRATVYFAWQDSTLTGFAGQTISKLVTAHKSENSIVFLVQGFNDSDGSHSDNFVLSAQMAASVANQIIGLGVDEKRIYREAFGERNLAKQTSDGIREPLNRRVIISAIRVGSAEG